MRKTLLAVGLVTFCFGFEISGYALSENVSDCVNSSDKVICVGKAIEKKLDDVLTVGGGEPELTSISYYDYSDCKEIWAVEYVPKILTATTLPTLKEGCRELSRTLAELSNSNSAIESVKVGRVCTSEINIDRKDKAKTYADCMSRVAQ